MLGVLIETQDPDKAQEAIDKLTALADEWALKLHDAEQEMKKVEATAGETVLASILQGNDGTGTAVTALANARAQYDVALRTLESIEHHQVIAAANLKLAQAYQLRQEAAQKAVGRDDHMAKVKALLDQLQELDGAPYVPFAPRPLMPGEWRDPQPRAIPVSETLQRQINDLLARAEQLEANAKSMLAQVDLERKKAANRAHG